ncbi:fumarylacetoacetate hydrolase family protein [Microdochium bolleyi]|uniref:Fumarylacetoacetate hydrolase family protein n=1 Tax=Microdochium bolleyi TaxID=196109 RepID=A0A136JFZ2_9PEZI|nr:fumarylacetoacetate hydrolase family protein [Microdochium bolleyi]
MAVQSFTRLMRFVPKASPARILIGEPEDFSVDVGRALFDSKEVYARVWSGKSILAPGEKTEGRELVDRVLSPLARDEVGTIRCIGLNYVQHAQEVGIDLPKLPTVFLKPAEALGDPWPQPTLLPKITQSDNTGDYESELAVVIGKECKNVSKEDAMDYVLGYTAANDVSSRGSQFAQSQWCYSKGFDGSCPIGPTIVSKSLVPDVAKLHMRGLHNDKVMQDCGIDDLIFKIPEVVSFLSQGTTLKPGTVIITGTPAGVGVGKNPKVTIKHGDTFAVEILPHIGTLVNKFENEA